MAKFFRSLFGTRKVRQPDPIREEELPVAEFGAPSEQAARGLDVLGRRTVERAEAPEISLGPLGQMLRGELGRVSREQAAPGFFARGMGGQAGAAGLGAFMARGEPSRYLQAFETEEEVTRQRLRDIEPFLAAEFRERGGQFETAKGRAEQSALLAGMRYGQRVRQAQEESKRLKERRGLWGDIAGTAVDVGAAVATGGASIPFSMARRGMGRGGLREVEKTAFSGARI